MVRQHGEQCTTQEFIAAAREKPESEEAKTYRHGSWTSSGETEVAVQLVQYLAAWPELLLQTETLSVSQAGPGSDCTPMLSLMACGTAGTG